MSFALYYASKTIMRITEVVFFEEAAAYKHYGLCLQWNDVIRARVVALESGEVVRDEIVHHRLCDPESADREDSLREIAGRMDKVFVADRSFDKRRKDAPATTPRKALAVNASAEMCLCGHSRVQHNGNDSSGYCHSQCPTKCQRFRMKR